MARNPKWEREELILALDLYKARRGNSPSMSSRAVIEHAATADLSKLLTQRAVVLGIVRGDERFRNEAGVNMKLMNFLALDPDYAGQSLTHGGKRDKEIWDEFASDPAKLRSSAAAIRHSLSLAPATRILDQVDEDDEEFLEGRVALRLHRQRERNPALARKKKRQALKTKGRLACDVCAFDFPVTYGDLGEGYIECHHLVPVSEWRGEVRITRLSDLALVCSNCHRMLHRRRPWLSIDDLRAVIAALVSA